MRMESNIAKTAGSDSNRGQIYAIFTRVIFEIFVGCGMAKIPKLRRFLRTTCWTSIIPVLDLWEHVSTCAFHGLISTSLGTFLFIS